MIVSSLGVMIDTRYRELTEWFTMGHKGQNHSLTSQNIKHNIKDS